MSLQIVFLFFVEQRSHPIYLCTFWFSLYFGCRVEGTNIGWVWYSYFMKSEVYLNVWKTHFNNVYIIYGHFYKIKKNHEFSWFCQYDRSFWLWPFWRPEWVASIHFDFSLCFELLRTSSNIVEHPWISWMSSMNTKLT